MKTYRTTVVLALILPIVLCDLLCAQTNDSVEVIQIIQNLRDRFQLIHDYRVELEVSLDMPKLRMPRKRMTLTFKQPDKTRLEAKGFAMVPRRGLALAPDSLLKEIHHLTVIGDTLFNGYRCRILRGREEVLEEGSLIANIMVDNNIWVLRGITTFMDTTRIMQLVIDYVETAPGIFLPSQTRMNFKLDERFLRNRTRHGGPYDPDLPGPSLPEDDAMEGSASIQFSHYQVNFGVPDSYFEDSDRDDN
ncbi:hypothetical protein ACFL5M_04605 [Candidatus Neomarinimicrobiota bacterium]